MKGDLADPFARTEHPECCELSGVSGLSQQTDDVEGAQSFRPAEPFLRGTVSFVRRDNRLRPRLQRIWDAHHTEWMLDVPRLEASMSVAPGHLLEPLRDFGREAPLVVEIGSGTGDAVVKGALASPGTNFLAVEVYRPGLALTVAKIVRNKLTNVRLVHADGMQVLQHMVGPGSAAEIWVFFADPWHKNRHHKRRLVNPVFAELTASRLAPGGTLRLATDWADYARQMSEVLAACGSLTNPYAELTSFRPRGGVQVGATEQETGFAPRFEGRAMTRFEQKAVASGRAIYDLELLRV